MAPPNAAPASFLWHDYETFGADPRRDRPAQFAALRTDADLNEIGDPIELYCKPADDYLPHPAACLITGITPQKAQRRGLPEAEFARQVQSAMSEPGTCVAGYNSLRFDDEVSRHLFYRNLLDPYAREWQNGNSRWDLIDVVRAFYALRPEGIEWPLREDGAPSFKLEHLTAANGIAHEGAHDAVADVRATIALARLLKARNPKLFDYLLGLRGKRAVAKQLDLPSAKPLLHISRRYPASRGCSALVMPLVEFVGRMGWSLVLILSLVLTYRICDAIWGTFAYPFYLGELQYTNDEVAFASKFFGVGAIIAGLAIGGYLLTAIGRMATLTLGALIAALTNLLYADMAAGGANMQAASDAIGFSALIGFMAPFGSEALPRLTFTIMWENLAIGIAGAAYVAWLSSIVSKKYSAVQYALLSSLTLLVGTLGRGALGEMIEKQGYFDVFILTTLIGMLAVVLCVFEWIRVVRSGRSQNAPPPGSEAVAAQ